MLHQEPNTEAIHNAHTWQAGIYLHVPFCKQACHYCDFHFSTNTSRRSQMVQAMCEEIALQKNFFPDHTILQSIYLGGGTPSLLHYAELATLLEQIHRYFKVAPDAEITLEANPDDISKKTVTDWHHLGFNRLSIGIQSFHEPLLQWMNRAHNAHDARQAVVVAQEAGFELLTTDLIYGLPHPDHSILENDLQEMLSLNVPHLSAYCLTIEPDTVFGRLQSKGTLPEVSEDFAATQYKIVVKHLTAAGYEHYEISNYARNGLYAVHNSNYWKKGLYLGVGPSAHSYDGQNRYHNVANNARYIKSLLDEKKLPSETEILSPANHANEYIITSLRTMWGCDTELLEKKFSCNLLQNAAEILTSYQATKHLEIKGKSIVLTEKGRLIADSIAADLLLET